ncbi:hypothetical protein FGO68_gene8327 [Halteria grandinella]|uniref:Uncharacterized protein n=1 Tax=Halteria grandinella TaxID=5974 RepID=A0A8J8T839_HALGN|nr:hypothetical protein FGO68_gene8327 [Halteria grandinella]
MHSLTIFPIWQMSLESTKHLVSIQEKSSMSLTKKSIRSELLFAIWKYYLLSGSSLFSSIRGLISSRLALIALRGFLNSWAAEAKAIACISVMFLCFSNSCQYDMSRIVVIVRQQEPELIDYLKTCTCFDASLLLSPTLEKQSPFFQ